MNPLMPDHYPILSHPKRLRHWQTLVSLLPVSTTLPIPLDSLQKVRRRSPSTVLPLDLHQLPKRGIQHSLLKVLHGSTGRDTIVLCSPSHSNKRHPRPASMMGRRTARQPQATGHRRVLPHRLYQPHLTHRPNPCRTIKRNEKRPSMTN